MCTLYTAIDTDQLVKEIDMFLSVIKASKPNIKNVMFLKWTLGVRKYTSNTTIWGDTNFHISGTPPENGRR